MWIEEKWSVEVAENIVSHLSSGRKIFRFLKFIETLRKIYEYHELKKEYKKPLMKTLTYTRLVCAFFLYLTDNILWFANMGIIEKMIFQKLKWKRFKDFFA